MKLYVQLAKLIQAGRAEAGGGECVGEIAREAKALVSAHMPEGTQIDLRWSHSNKLILMTTGATVYVTPRLTDGFQIRLGLPPLEGLEPADSLEVNQETVTRIFTEALNIELDREARAGGAQ